MEFRIEAVANKPGLTGAFVFAAAPALPAKPRFVVERDARENTKLGGQGWTVAPRPMKPRRIERRGGELWIYFGTEVSHWVLTGTPVLVTVLGTALSGEYVWPGIPRGTAPPPPQRDEDDGWDTEYADESDDTVVLPRPLPQPEPEPQPKPQPAPEPEAEPEPEPERPPPLDTAPEPAIEPQPERVLPAPAWRRWWWLALLLVACVVAAGIIWHRLHKQPVVPPAPAPVPVVPVVPVVPATSPCADIATILAGGCAATQLHALAPDQQAELAEKLLAKGGANANTLALQLLNEASTNHSARAAETLGRLYDPTSFRPDGPLHQPNAGRALELFGQAAQGQGGHASAQAARQALIDRLRATAQGQGPQADEARQTLREAGVQ